MAARKLKNKLVHISSIEEEMRLIDGSNTDYITPTAKIYKDYGNGYFYHKKSYQNKKNLYLYVEITYADGKNKNRRLHRLLAQAYIPNPDPLKLKEVGYKDGWQFYYLDEIEYKDASSYQNLIDYVDDITIKNINTNEIISFKTKQEMSNYFGLRGNAVSDYINKKFLIMHEWKVIDNIYETN